VCTLNILNVILICFITSLEKLRNQPTFDIASLQGKKFTKSNGMAHQFQVQQNIKIKTERGKCGD